MSAHLERAALLYHQGRYDLADTEVRKALGEDPDRPAAHALLAGCLSHRGRHEEAQAAAQEAVRLGPGLAATHQALAEVLARAEKPNAALAAIEHAIELDPSDADSRGLLALIRFNLRDWKGALAAADEGLALHGEHGHCQNFRAMALVKLGRRAEASATIAGALERDPDDALTHANQGWTLLEQSRPAEALEHFREALRIDPELAWARAGIVEALKARHLVYRVMLRFFLWMGRQTRWMQWVIILGVLFGQKALDQAGRQFPALAPFVGPLIFALISFTILTWIADPLFNLLLRLNRFGRLALTPQQILASNCLGALLMLAAISLGWFLVSGHPTGLVSAMVCGVMTVPVSGAFNVPKSNRRVFALGALVLAGFGCAAVYWSWRAEQMTLAADARPYLQSMGACLQVFFIGLIVYSFAANIAVSRRPSA